MFSTWVSGTDHCGFLRGSFTTETQLLSCGRYRQTWQYSIVRHHDQLKLVIFFFIMWEVNCWSVWSWSPLIPRWFSGCLQQHEWQCIQAKQHDQTSRIPWRRGLHSSPWLWSIIFFPGARGDNEECDFSNTSSEACSQEVDRIFRRRKTKLSESIWLFRESP